MDEQKLNTLQTFLMAHGSSLEALPKARANQLSMVYDAVEIRRKRLETAKSSIKDSAITVLSIASDTGISRKTFYNNELLKLYVEESASAVEPVRPSDISKETASYKEQIKILEEQIRLMSIRDVEYLNLEHKIAELSREIMEKDSRIRNLENAYEKVLAENKNLKAKLPHTSAEIIHLPNK